MATTSGKPGVPEMPAHQAGASNTEAGAQPAVLDQSGIHILLVDDERLSRVVVANQLRKCNYKVTVAESGGQALELLQQQAPGTFQLLLTDVMMPQVDGIDLLRFVRSNHNFMDLPVVMMSASEQAETMCECIRGGAEEYLVKPVTQKEIQKIWTHVLRRSSNGVNIAPQLPPPTRIPSMPNFPDVANNQDASLPHQPQPSTAAAPGLISALPQHTLQPQITTAAQPEAASLSPTPLHLLQQPPAKLVNGAAQPAHDAVRTGTTSTGPDRQAASGGGARPGEASVQQMCMRQWLSRPSRPNQSAESLWVFTQTVLLLERWTAGTGASCCGSRLRPSQLLLHSNGRVDWAKHAQPAPATHLPVDPRTTRPTQQPAALPASTAASAGHPSTEAPAVQAGQTGEAGTAVAGNSPPSPPPSPQPGALQPTATSAVDELEKALYLSPEEVSGQPGSPTSDVFRLGLLLFELLTVPSKQARPIEAWCHNLQQARQGSLPESLLQAKPAESSLLKAMLHHDPNKRCTLTQLLQSSLIKSLAAAMQANSKPGAAAKAPASTSQSRLSELLLVDFLRIMHSRKRTELQVLESSLWSLDHDIEVLEQVLKSRKVSRPPPARSKSFSAVPASPGASGLVTRGSVGTSGVPSSPRPDMSPFAAAMASKEAGGARAGVLTGEWGALTPATSGPVVTANNLPTTGSHDQAWISAQETWKRLAGSHVALEELYTSRRKQAPGAAGGKTDAVAAAPGGTGALATAVTGPAAEAAAVVPSGVPCDLSQTAPSPGTQAVPAARPSLPDMMSTFCEDLLGFSRYKELKLRASLQQGDTLSSSNMVCSIAIDRDDELFASAGVSKRIRIYELSGIMHGATLIAGAYPVLELTSRSRLSSVCWSSYIKSHLAAADYEGVVALWDVHANVELVQFEEHAKRVWAVDLCRKDPSRLASASDDGTVRIWAVNQESSVATVPCHANVCSVQWNPESAHLFACGSANCRASVYDMRNLSRPLVTISSHQKAVSYVRHMSSTQLLTASTDNTIRRWDLSAVQGDINVDAPQPESQLPCLAVYKGHVNERNFVGLSVSSDAYIACGSEDNDLKCYYQAMPFPALSHSFSEPGGPLSLTAQHAAREQVAQSSGPQAFVSTVCWAQSRGLLLAANSLGAIHVMELA